MRRLVFAVGITMALCACNSETKEGSEIKSLEKYKEDLPPQQSRPQIKFYSESEGTLRPIEKDIQKIHEQQKAGLVLTPGKQAALVILETSVATSRTKVNELKKVGASDWEPLKPGIEEALAQTKKFYDEMNATP
ncbi:MAG: hypothetical protein ACAI38_24295 [Myxococcota bacterium]